MLLDRYLPQYDVTETHAVIIDADTDLTWQAVRRSDLSRSAVIRVLLEMRSLPNRLQRVLKRQPTEAARPPLTLHEMQRAQLLLLGESPGHEIVFGTVVQPWKAVTGDEPAPQVEPGRFAAFDTPGYMLRSPSTSGWSPTAAGAPSHDDRDTDGDRPPRSLRRFTRYWPPIGPSSALIRPLTRDREIRCRATDLASRAHPPARRVSRLPGAGQATTSTPEQTAGSCPHRTPAPNVGLSRGGGDAETNASLHPGTVREGPARGGGAICSRVAARATAEPWPDITGHVRIAAPAQ